MVNQPSCFLRTYDRLIERLQRQRFTSALNRPAPTRQSVRREHIGHKSGVEKPLTGTDIGNVSHPQPIRPRSSTFTFHQVRASISPPEVCELPHHANRVDTVVTLMNLNDMHYRQQQHHAGYEHSHHKIVIDDSHKPPTRSVFNVVQMN